MPCKKKNSLTLLVFIFTLSFFPSRYFFSFFSSFSFSFTATRRLYSKYSHFSYACLCAPQDQGM